MNGASRWWHALLYRLYDRLTLEDSVQPAGLIFVMAGRMERKPYGLELYRAGIAPRLLLSIGRFEVSKMRILDSEFSAAELIDQRDRTAPGDRHFFCEISAAGTRIESVRLRRWNTYGEVLGLHDFLRREPAPSVLVVSTSVHLRRVAEACRRVFRHTALEIRYCPVPPPVSSVRKQEWWTRPADRSYVLKEVLKLAAYRAIFILPESIVGRVMRLKD